MATCAAYGVRGSLQKERSGLGTTPTSQPRASGLVLLEPWLGLGASMLFFVLCPARAVENAKENGWVKVRILRRKERVQDRKVGTWLPARVSRCTKRTQARRELAFWRSPHAARCWSRWILDPLMHGGPSTPPVDLQGGKLLGRTNTHDERSSPGRNSFRH